MKTEFNDDMEDAGRPGSRTRQMMNGLARSGESRNPLVHGSPAADIVPELTLVSLDLVEIRLRDALFLEYNALVLSDCPAGWDCTRQRLRVLTSSLAGCAGRRS